MTRGDRIVALGTAAFLVVFIVLLAAVFLQSGQAAR